MPGMVNRIASAHASGERSRVPEQARLRLLGQRRRLAPVRMQHQHDPRDERERGDDAPLPQRDLPARGLRDRHGHERRHEGAHRQRRDVERREQPDPIGEVPLHERRQQHVADADRGERERGRRQQPDGVAREAATEEADREGEEGDDQRRLEVEPLRDERRHDAEHRVAERGQHAEQADDRRRERDVALELGEDRRERRDGGAQVERDEDDADQREAFGRPRAVGTGSASSVRV